ncbi:ankyrin repeat domain-containing protein 23 isoform X5 [Emydura macquarii macquarii]|uniref:ankyrin repeat domain-containing protein 23 isoform X5 n=1 Tax=Emydura macquarii macquarii TaxID=1129001 RepID=UPI00352B29D7
MSHGEAPSPFPVPSLQVSGDRYAGEVRAFEVLARGAAQAPKGWRHGVVGVREAVSQEKQKVKEERRKKLEALNSSRLRLDSLQDLEALVRLRKQKRRQQRVTRPRAPQPEGTAEPVDEERFLQAVLENRLPVIDKYLAEGGDPNVHDKFRCTALHWACLRGHADVVEKLLQAGATLEPRDMLEATPLVWACRGGHLQILKRLLEQGAKICRRDKVRGRGWRPRGAGWHWVPGRVCGCLGYGARARGCSVGGSAPPTDGAGSFPALWGPVWCQPFLGSPPAPSCRAPAHLYFPSLPVLNSGVRQKGASLGDPSLYSQQSPPCPAPRVLAHLPWLGWGPAPPSSWLCAPHGVGHWDGPWPP